MSDGRFTGVDWATSERRGRDLLSTELRDSDWPNPRDLRSDEHEHPDGRMARLMRAPSTAVAGWTQTPAEPLTPPSHRVRRSAPDHGAR
jgi:hypothetical protein